MVKGKTPPYIVDFDIIEKVRVGDTIHNPTFYWGSTGGRNNPMDTEWKYHSVDKIDHTRDKIIDLLGEVVSNVAYSVLTFPHVTTIFVRTTNEGMRHSNGLSFLYNTADMTLNEGIVVAKNGVSTCGLEKYVDFIERHLWDNTWTVEEYYAEDREKQFALLRSVGFGLPKLLNTQKL